jgi:ABC-type uncharacterized transport system substrate-binding protein
MSLRQITRRDFIAGVGVAAWAVKAQGQQPVPVVGFLGSTSLTDRPYLIGAFRDGLNDLNYMEGKNLAVEYRWADGNYDRLPALASELVRLRVRVIVAPGPPASVLAAKAATTSIPIVFMTGGDPIALGLVASLNRPGGNLTGVSLFNVALVPKQLELAREIVPQARLIAALVNPNNPNTETEQKELEAAARVLGLEIDLQRAGSEEELTDAFAAIKQRGAGAVVVSYDAFFGSVRDKLVALATRYSLPAIYHWRDYAESGGLVSYGTNLADANRQTGKYVGKILQGAKPADLPVWQQTKFELVINMKAAKAVGLTLPPSLLARADEVLE